MSITRLGNRGGRIGGILNGALAFRAGAIERRMLGGNERRTAVAASAMLLSIALMRWFSLARPAIRVARGVQPRAAFAPPDAMRLSAARQLTIAHSPGSWS